MTDHGEAAAQLAERNARWRSWRRQARGVHDAAAAAHARPAQLGKTAATWLALQAGIVLLMLLALSVAGPVVPSEATIALVVVTLFLALASNFGIVIGAESDVLREIEQKVLDTLYVSPLPGSAYLAGKLAFHLRMQIFHLACLLPSFSLCYLLRAMDLSDVLVVFLVLLGATAFFATSLIGRAHRLQSVRRLGKKASVGGGRAAGGYVAMTFVTGFVVQGMASLPGTVTGVETLLVLASLLPGVGLLSTLVSELSIVVFGARLPLWLAGLGAIAVFLPATVGDARRRWKLPARSGGQDLRLGQAAACLCATLLLAGTARTSDGYAWSMLVFTAIALAVVPAWASCSELSDAGRLHAAGRGNLLIMRRDSGAAYSWSLITLCLALFALVAPFATPQLATAWPLAGALALAAFPVVLVLHYVGRAVKPARATAMALALAAFAVSASLVLLPDMAMGAVEAFGLSNTVRDPVETCAQFVASASPATTLFGLAAIAAPKVFTSGPPGVEEMWPFGIAMQIAAAAVLARRCSRKRARESVPQAVRPTHPT